MKKYWLYVLLSTFILTNLSHGAETKASSHATIPVATKSPVENKTYPIVIIGAGAAGTMAVKRAVMNNNEVLLFAGAKDERRRSRGYWVRQVDNVPGLGKYTRTILELRNETLEDLVKGPFGENLTVAEESVFAIEKTDDKFKLVDGQGRTFYAKYVILATGMMDEQPHIQGSIRPILPYANGQTVAYCLVCDGHRSLGKKTVVIGHSEDAANGSILLKTKYQLKDVSLLTNGTAPQVSDETLKKMQAMQISLHTSPIQEILGDKDAKKLSGFKLEDGAIVDADLGFVMLGIRPNNQLALQLGAQVDARGLVVTDANGESSVPNLFIAGDLRANSMKQIYTAWQHGVDAAQLINKRLRN